MLRVALTKTNATAEIHTGKAIRVIEDGPHKVITELLLLIPYVFKKSHITTTFHWLLIPP